MLLTIQKKSEKERNSRVNLDNICWGILPDRILLPLFPIPFYSEISDDKAEELIALIAAYARDQLFKYLGVAEHNSHQCRDLLSRKKIHPSLIDALIAEFIDKKYIDDARFVNILIESLLERGKSKNYIKGKLRELNMPAELWENALNEAYNPETTLDNLKEMILKLRLSYRDLPPAKQKEKIINSLYRKGFDLDDIFTAWNET